MSQIPCRGPGLRPHRKVACMGTGASVAGPAADSTVAAAILAGLCALPPPPRASWAKIQSLPCGAQAEAVLLKLEPEGFVRFAPGEIDDTYDADADAVKLPKPPPALERSIVGAAVKR